MAFDSVAASRRSGEGPRLRVAVIGSGVSGLTAAWLLSARHEVTVFERDNRFGGHANTAIVETASGPVPVDAGFIVFNKPNYPNLTALFDHLGVALDETCMSFAASLDDGRIEYSGRSLSSVFTRRRTVLSPSHWAMLRDVTRFHRDARASLTTALDDGVSLGDFVRSRGYSASFVSRFLEPMAAAIWSTPSVRILDFPAYAFFRFFANHGLLQVLNMPLWNTVAGGSVQYVDRLIAAIGPGACTGRGAAAVRRVDAGVEVVDDTGRTQAFDHVVIAAHADTALRLLERPTPREEVLLGAFGYQKNRAILHRNPGFMPKRRRAWASWNYIGGEAAPAVTYWMNRLQTLPCTEDIFITLNPQAEIPARDVIAEYDYDHPVFDIAAGRAQKELWTLQGEGGVWFCGAHFGQGFHEDGAQAGLAVAEAIGGVRRPWTVENESGRIFLAPTPKARPAVAA